jgi:hypothetical protein
MRLSYTKNGKHHLIMDKLEGYQKACKLQDNDLKNERNSNYIEATS